MSKSVIRLPRRAPDPAPPPTSPLPDAPTLSEVFATVATDGAAPGFVLAQVPRGAAPVLWVQDRLSLRETGRPYLAGLAPPPTLLCLTVNRAVDVLWAMEQGLACGDLAGVVGEVWGDPPALDFTATKRLAMRAETHGIPAWMLRRAGTAHLSAARARWRIASLPSTPDAYDAHAPGAARWRAELFRARHRAPGVWTAGLDAEGHGLHFAPQEDAAQAPVRAGATG